MNSVHSIHVPPALRGWRRFELDDALLLFERESGWNALCDGLETVGLRQRAPRAVQFAITNACNLACGFCSRELDASSEWTVDSAFEFLRDLGELGVLEVAFGGGEPFAFSGYARLVRRLREETPLAIGATTNGRLIDDAKLAAVRGVHSQLRLSLYDDVDWTDDVRRLCASGERVGVNWLVTPARLASLECTLLRLAARGCRDVLLLRYKGRDRALHLDHAQAEELGQRVALLARSLQRRMAVKLDVCFGEWLAAAPRLFNKNDCGAGREFVVITSDKRLASCSFESGGVRVESANDVIDLWNERRAELAAPVDTPGCARLADHGLYSL